ncbi:L-fucose:H+ symporter permease [Flavobacteriaceae bacterium]|nr:L-fucose:H+ symporter permease [Flavobacteriaceae bacterium]
MSNQESNQASPKLVDPKLIVPFVVVTSLFFLWGVANDLTNPMVSAFKKIMPELSNFEAALVQLAFYGGYGTMAIPAALFIRKYNYKSGILLGLALYAIGAVLFWPAANYEEFTFFLLSLYVLTFGLAFLETTANPFILALGDSRTATQRLNLSQAFNPIGSLTGMAVAQLVIIQALRSDDYTEETYNALTSDEVALIRQEDLSIISDVYVGLGIAIIFIFLLVLFIKIPGKNEENKLTIRENLSLLLKNKRYYEGVIAQVFYVGTQIMCWTFIFQYVDNINSNLPKGEQLTATWYNMAAMGLFLASRWLCTWLFNYIKPARLMFYFGLAGMLLTLGAILLTGVSGLYCLVGISMTMSLMFPTIYGIALKDMGEEAKLGSAGLVMAIVGGALMPPLQAKILDWGGPGFNDVKIFGWIDEVNFSFILPLIGLAVVALYSYRSLQTSD